MPTIVSMQDELNSQVISTAVAQEAWKNENITTMSEYLAYTKQAKVEPDVTELDSGLKLCWLGPKNAKKVLLYLHGGGYVSGASRGHFQWAADLQQTCSKDASFSVVFVAYTLTTLTSGRYPIQLQESAAALHWLIEKHGKKAGDIMLGGVSFWLSRFVSGEFLLTNVCAGLRRWASLHITTESSLAPTSGRYQDRHERASSICHTHQPMDFIPSQRCELQEKCS